jgi:hypothetical protein
MMQSWEMERMASQHQRNLRALSGAPQNSRRGGITAAAATRPTTLRSATGLPVTGGRAVRRAVAGHVGDWLIRAGTRLEGGSIRTS